MKNYILLLLLATFGTQAQTLQNPTFGTVKIKNNITSATATKVNVQEANGEVNTQTINTGFNKNIGLGGSDVVGANTLLNQYSTTPVDWTATAFNSGQVVFYAGKQWIAKIATVAGDVPAVSLKWDEITFEALANKTTTVDQTIIDGSTNAVSGNAVFDGLALKSNIGHTHVASQITDLSKASVGLGNVDNTSDINKPISTATQTALDLKANLASPSLTGTPTAPTATAGTNTTQIATTAFVTGANAGNVKLTGSQNVTGIKSFSNPNFAPIQVTTNNGNGILVNATTGIGLQSTSSGNFTAANFTGQAGANTLTITNQSGSTGAGLVISNTGSGVNIVSSGGSENTFIVDKFGATTATSFIKSSSPATNILLAGGGDIAQNTAFNKNFGTTAGTVVEGGTLGSNAYTSTAFLPLSGGTVSGNLFVSNSTYSAISVKGTNSGDLGGGVIRFENQSKSFAEITGEVESAGNGVIYFRSLTNGVTSEKLRINSNGNATFSGSVTATSYTATSLPVFENNAAASSLAVGQFYRTSIGVLMVKF